MSKRLVFVDHELRDGRVRVKDSGVVARHIGTHYRNRSKPSQRPWRSTLPRSRRPTVPSSRTRREQKSPEVEIIPRSSEQLWTVGHRDTAFDNHHVSIWVEETEDCGPRRSNQTVARLEPPFPGFLPSPPSVAWKCLVGDDVPPDWGEAPTEDSGQMPPCGSSTKAPVTCASSGRGVYTGPGKALCSYIHFPYPSKYRATAEFGLDFAFNYMSSRCSTWGKGVNRYSKTWVQVTTSADSLLDALAATALGVQATTIEGRETPTAAVLLHRARALAGLQARIVDPVKCVENQTFLTVFYLLENAARFGNVAEFSIHYSGLQKMLAIRGSIQSECLEDVFVNQAIQLVEATETASDLRYKVSGNPEVYQRGSLPASISEIECLPLDLTMLPPGFQDLARQGQFSVEAIQILCDTPHNNRWTQELKASEQQRVVVERARRLFQVSSLPVERLTCLGVIAFCMRMTTHMQLFPEIAFFRRLVEASRYVAGDRQRLIRELRVWVILIGADMASATNAILRRHANGSLREIQEQEKWIESWNDVEGAMKKFFWSEAFQEGWQKCWERKGDEIGRIL